MITFGLTGGIACGKSTVTKTFRANNIPIVDADVVAREVVVPNSIGWVKIRDAFGEGMLNNDETINRAELGKLVFENKGAMRLLNLIMGPMILEESSRQIKKLHDAGNQIVGYDAALICEMGNAHKYRPLIVVNCPFEMQIERLIKRNNLTYDQAKARIDAQIPLSEKVKLADYVIDTSGTIENSEKQTLDIISKLKECETI